MIEQAGLRSRLVNDAAVVIEGRAPVGVMPGEPTGGVSVVVGQSSWAGG